MYIIVSLLAVSIALNVFAYCIALPQRNRERRELQNIITAITQTAYECTERARDTVARCNEVIKQFEKRWNPQKK